MIILFWFSVFFVIITYIGYPLLLCMRSYFCLSCLHKVDGCSLHSVSVIISAKNEAHCIAARIENLRSQNYPADKMEIIVVSDGSVDETTAIVESFMLHQPLGKAAVILLSNEQSMGKPYALNRGVKQARGDILVFADARQNFAEDAISHLVANFSDPTIGAVSGELILLEGDGDSIRQQVGAYWKYEKLVRKLESKTGSVVGATGAIYAIRKKLYKELPSETLLDDVLTPLNVALQGYRVVFDADARAYDHVSEDMGREWRRKVRTLAGNWQLLSLRPELLLPWKNPLFFRLFWHKIARLLVPYFLILLLLASVFSGNLYYQCIAWLQFLVYLLVLSAHYYPNLQENKFIRILYFFSVMNVAVLKGFYVWISGGCKYVWNK